MYAVMSFRMARDWARRAMKWHRLEGFLLLKSSNNNYHAVFNRKVDWSDNMRVVAWVALLSRKPKLQRWLLMQCIKQGATLRVGPKGDKSPPRIIYRNGREDGQIREFLEFRKLVKRIMRRLEVVCE